jgi:hypothetical protein
MSVFPTARLSLRYNGIDPDNIPVYTLYFSTKEDAARVCSGRSNIMWGRWEDHYQVVYPLSITSWAMIDNNYDVVLACASENHCYHYDVGYTYIP